MKKFEFISYSGKFPNLCSGVLVFKTVDEEGNERPYHLKYCLISGGKVEFNPETSDCLVTNGPWTFQDFCFDVVNNPKEYASFPEFTLEDKIALTKMINENIPQGCCGGCE